MATPTQNRETGKRTYAAGSVIQQRNAMLSLAKRIGAARASDKGVVKFVGLDRVMSATEYCGNGEKCEAQVNKDREPFLLVPDVYNDGEFLPMAIYDSFVDGIEAKTGLCKIEVHAGTALVAGDTLVYWK